MTYVLINSACDGRHVRAFKTEAAALKAMADWFGRPVDGYVSGRTYYGDWGNRLTVEERPSGHTVAREARLAKAYDARECGTATKSQMALLESLGF